MRFGFDLSGTSPGGISPTRKDQPLFTLRQVGMICERLLKEREEKVREEYEETMTSKLAGWCIWSTYLHIHTYIWSQICARKVTLNSDPVNFRAVRHLCEVHTWSANAAVWGAARKLWVLYANLYIHFVFLYLVRVWNVTFISLSSRCFLSVAQKPLQHGLPLLQAVAHYLRERI